MADLLLELLSEEIPARMQARAGADLDRLMGKALGEAGLTPGAARHHSGPRRLTFVAEGLPLRTEDVTETRKGPKLGAPEKAVQGFLRSAGLASVDEARIEEGKKGAFYVADIHTPGRDTADVLAEIVPALVRAFPWPKAMRWGAGDLAWVRPLRRVLCTLDGAVVPLTIPNGEQPIESGALTEGHRFTHHETFEAATLDAYERGLAERRVVLSAEERRARIPAGARAACAGEGLELVPDDGLLAETAGLAEWPVPRLGAFDEKFLRLPDEVLTASMKGHQKYFSVRDPATGRLAPRFVTVANVEPADGGAAMMAGYERVLTARLSDGLFLYDQDRKKTLAEHAEKLSGITFFEGLGTIADKVERVAALAREIAPKVGANPDDAERAARLAKADLTTEMVGEFPELQGVMGRYYALEEGLEPEVADAIRDHYAPQGQGDAAPTAPVSVAVALADKLDTVMSLWLIGQQPTGSRDPLALRRSAIAAIQILILNDCRFQISQSIIDTFMHLLNQLSRYEVREINESIRKLARDGISVSFGGIREGEQVEGARKFFESIYNNPEVSADSRQYIRAMGDVAQKLTNNIPGILPFFHDRLTQYLRDQGHRHDRIAAALRPDGDDLARGVALFRALNAFLDTPEGADLTAAYKRAANILRAEAKKGDVPDGAPDPDAFVQDEECALFGALEGVSARLVQSLDDEDYEGAMSHLATLRGPLDAFFEAVTVNAEDAGLRANRLRLLGEIKRVCERVADLGKLEG